jgi:hypothetical protein
MTVREKQTTLHNTIRLHVFVIASEAWQSMPWFTQIVISPVIASTARQSRLLTHINNHSANRYEASLCPGSPRRYTPRDDGWRKTDHLAQHPKAPYFRHCEQ